MKNIKLYFNAEKNESLLFILIGLIAIGVSIYFLIILKKPFFNGISVPLIALAIIQLIVGTTVYNRCPKEIARLEHIIAKEKNKIAGGEIPRMDSVMKSFVIYRWIEIIFIMAGILFIFQFRDNPFINGIGFGLSIQSAILLTLDFFAEKRGIEYLSYLKSLIDI